MDEPVLAHLLRGEQVFDGSLTRDLAFLRPDVWEAVQGAILRRHLASAARSPFHRERFAAAGFDPVAGLAPGDLAVLPLSGKDDLAGRSADFLAVSPRELVDLCLTSGTTGLPVAIPQTESDLLRLAYNEEASFRLAGLTADDTCLVAAAVDRCFMAGLAYVLGLRRLGATTLRGGSSSLAMLAELVKRFRPTAMVGVPTLMLALAERLAEEGTDPATLGMRRLVCIGEPVRGEDLELSALGARLSDAWGASVHGTYASTEMATAFTDCEAGKGGHLPPDLMVVEIVDDEGRLVAPGELGEIVATPLGVTGMPLVRFRTGDVARLHAGPCPCGRTTPRLGPVVGRKAQMLKFRGTTVYPPAIFTVLQETRGIRGYYVEVFDEYELSDRIRVVVGLLPGGPGAAEIAERIAARTRVKPEVVTATPEEVQRVIIQDTKRKPVTFIDHRRHRHVD